MQGQDQLSLGIRAYFKERLRHRLYDLVLKEFDRYKASGRNRTMLAKRLGKRPEQITRWLSEPGNLTLDTLSDLLLALSGAELAASLEYPAIQPQRPPRIPEQLLAAKRRVQAAQIQHSTPLASIAHTATVPMTRLVSTNATVVLDQPFFGALAQ